MKFRIWLLIILFFFIWGICYYSHYGESLPGDMQIDRIVVEKSKRHLLVYSKGQLIKTYPVSMGRSPVGDKQFEGDKKTPEGIYFIDSKNPHSECYKNLGISYPNSKDVEDARKLGRKTGGSIKIHGLLNGKGWVGRFHLFMNWTAGCIAVTNREMDELYNAVPVGTRVEIKP